MSEALLTGIKLFSLAQGYGTRRIFGLVSIISFHLAPVSLWVSIYLLLGDNFLNVCNSGFFVNAGFLIAMVLGLGGISLVSSQFRLFRKFTQCLPDAPLEETRFILLGYFTFPKLYRLGIVNARRRQQYLILVSLLLHEIG